MTISTSGIAGITEKHRKAFEFFLKALTSSGVNSEEDFGKLALKFKEKAKKLGVDFDEMMEECALWMKQCVPAGHKKWTKENDMSGFDKKGFDKFYKYAPKEIKDTLKSGGQALLNIFSQEYAHASVKAFVVENDGLFAKKVIDNKLYTTANVGKAMRLSEEEAKNLVDSFIFGKVVEASAYDKLKPEIVKYYEENSEELEDEWQLKMDTMEDSDFEHVRKLRNSDIAFFEFVENKYYELFEATAYTSFFAEETLDFETLKEALKEDGFEFSKEDSNSFSVKDKNSNNYVWVFKNRDSCFLTRYGGSNPTFLILYIYEKFEVTMTEEDDLAEATASIDMSYEEISKLKYKNKCINEKFGPAVGTRTVCRDMCELEYPFFAVKREIRNEVSYELREYTDFGSKLVKIIEPTATASREYTKGNIPYLRKASIEEVLDSSSFITEENVEKLFPNIESYSDVMDNRYTFLTAVPRYFILQQGDKEILVNTEGYDYPRYMIRIEPSKKTEAFIKKETVHNQLEAETLIKEAFSRGEEEKYNETEFFTHDGKKLFKCLIDTVDYEMVWPDGNSTKVDVISTASEKLSKEKVENIIDDLKSMAYYGVDKDKLAKIEYIIANSGVSEEHWKAIQSIIKEAKEFSDKEAKKNGLVNMSKMFKFGDKIDKEFAKFKNKLVDFDIEEKLNPEIKDLVFIVSCSYGREFGAIIILAKNKNDAKRFIDDKGYKVGKVYTAEEYIKTFDKEARESVRLDIISDANKLSKIGDNTEFDWGT